jgi:predicted Zn-dependent protease
MSAHDPTAYPAADRGAPRSLYERGAPAAAPAPVLGRDASEALARKVLGFARADETRVNVTSGAQGNTRFAVNQISTGGDTQNVVVSVQSTFGGRSASATTNRLDDAALRSVVERAEALARLAPVDPERMPLLEPQQYRESPGWVDASAALDAAGRAAAVRAVTEPARAAGLTTAGYLEHDAGATAVANSRGLFAYQRQTRASLTATMRTPDGTGSGWAGAVHNDVRRVDAASVAARAIEKARRSVNPVAVEPGRYTVVLEPTAVAALVGLLAGALGARLADEGRSFFSRPGGNKIGQRVVDERVTLVTDPFDPEAPAPAFGADGLPAVRTTWIENGVVRDLAYDRYWAQRNNRRPNSSGGGFGPGGGGGGGFGGVGSLRMSGGTASLDELIAGTERGLLVTRFFYIRAVDPRTILHTGLTRDGTFLIERGKITRAVKNMRWNESPVFLLNNLEALGRPERAASSEGGGGGTFVVPPLRARDFNFTSLSDAV